MAILGGRNTNKRGISILAIKGICGCGRQFYQDFNPDRFFDNDGENTITKCPNCNYPHQQELAKRIKALG